MAKRVTPIEEFERFAERLYNNYPTIQTRLDFDKSFDDYMEGLPKPKVLREKSWDILIDKFITPLPKGTKPRITERKKQKLKINKVYPQEYVAKYWDARKKHYNVKYVAKVVDKSGRIRYMNGQGKWIKPVKISKVKSKT